MKQYHDLVKHVLETGTRKENRTGIDTISTFNHNYEIDLANGFPLLTTKEVSWKNIVIEGLWFLSGKTSTAFLEKHGCKFWRPWQDEQGNVNSGYGPSWRNFSCGVPEGIRYEGWQESYAVQNDQISWVLAELKRNPMSRRMVVTAWHPDNAQTNKLPPCHFTWVLNVQNTPQDRTLNLHLTQRSADVALGVPYNIAGYAFLLQLFSHISGLKPGIFAHSLVDAHVYTKKADGSMEEYDHIPGLQEQIKRESKELPTLKINDNIRSLDDILALLDKSTEEIMSNFKLENYNPHPAIKFKVAV